MPQLNFDIYEFCIKYSVDPYQKVLQLIIADHKDIYFTLYEHFLKKLVRF